MLLAERPEPRTVRWAVGLVVVLVGIGCAACREAPVTAADPPAAPTVRTLTPVPLPPPAPASGEIRADLRQSSRDAALGRIQVWLDNDTSHAVLPTEISYRDARFRRPLLAERLRVAPAGSERGYPLTLPARPVCPQDADAGPPRLLLTQGSSTAPQRLRVTDPNVVISRHVSARCLELDVARVARISFADRVAVSRPGPGSRGLLTLVVRPTGRAGPRLVIDSVGGTPLLGSAGRSAWAPRAVVDSGGGTLRLRLPVRPARCDDHVFLESGGATAFLVRLRLDGRPGQLVVRMTPRGAAQAIGFARTSCGR